ncbi:MAG: hypothetical protein R3F24_07700 [Gammaproteobacteria bacterium]
MTIRPLAILVATATMAGPVVAAPPLEAYGNLPAVETIELSPSGMRFATIATIGEQRRLIVGTPEGEVLRVAAIGDRKVSGFKWVGDNHVLVRTHNTFKAPFLLAARQVELWGVSNLTVATGKVASVFDKLRCSGNTVFGEFGSATFDKHTYGYFSAVRFIETRTRDCMVDTSQGVLMSDLYKVDLDSGKVRRIARGSQRHRSWVVGSDGSIVAHDEFMREDGVWRLYAGKDHDKLLMEIDAPVVTPDLTGPGRTSGTVLVFDPTSDRDSVIEVNVGSGATEELAHDENTGTPLRDRDSDLLLGFDTDNPDYPEVFNQALRSRLIGTHKAFPGYQVRVLSFSQNFDRLIVFTDGNNDSGTYWLVNIPKGKADPIGYAYPKVSTKDVGLTRMFSY